MREGHLTSDIEPNRVNKEYLNDLFRFKDLFVFFALRDILVRYRQAFFGIAWAIIRPVMTMVMFTLIFGMIAKFPSDQVNYGLFALVGIISWQLFSNATQEACQCLINNSLLITKTYFPRMIIPTSQLMSHVVDFLVNGVFLSILLLIYGVPLKLNMLFFPFFIFLLMTLSLGMGLWVSSLTVMYRDFRIIVPFFLQFGMFLSPVGYGTAIIPEQYQWFYFINPLVGIIEGLRWSLYGISYPLLSISIIYSCIISSGLLISGFFYFRKMERTFADRL